MPNGNVHSTIRISLWEINPKIACPLTCPPFDEIPFAPSNQKLNKKSCKLSVNKAF